MFSFLMIMLIIFNVLPINFPSLMPRVLRSLMETAEVHVSPLYTQHLMFQVSAAGRCSQVALYTTVIQ